MIIIRPEIISPATKLVYCKTFADVLDHVYNHLLPLKESIRVNDRHLFSNALEHITYFESALSLPPRKALKEEISNWQFLKLLSACWREHGVAQPPKTAPLDLSHRLGLEKTGVTALNRYDVIYVQIFSGQENYSIFGADVLKLEQSLRRIMMLQKRLAY